MINLFEGDGELAYWILPFARERGVEPLAVRAVTQWSFDVVGLKRLQLNQASCRVAQKAGFALEGTFIGVGLSGLVEFTVDAVSSASSAP